MLPRWIVVPDPATSAWPSHRPTLGSAPSTSSSGPTVRSTSPIGTTARSTTTAIMKARSTPATDGSIGSGPAIPAAAPFTKPFDLSRLSTAELVKLLGDPNKWTQTDSPAADRRPQRPGRGARARSTARREHRPDRTRSPLGLERRGKARRSRPRSKRSNIPTPTCGCGQHGSCAMHLESRPRWQPALARRAAIEPDVEVRSQLACSAKRLPARDALADRAGPCWLAVRMSATSTFRSCSGGRSRPRSPPTLSSCWRFSRIARSGACPSSRQRSLERLMRRFAAAGTRQDLSYCARLLALAPGPGARQAADGGFRVGLRRPAARRAAARAGRCPREI